MRAVAELWEEHRGAVFGTAYRLLGSVTDAEDVTSEVWLRAAAQPLDEIDDPRAWLVTVAARRAYDVLRSARVRRERYVGPWLPEPWLTASPAAGGGVPAVSATDLTRSSWQPDGSYGADDGDSTASPVLRDDSVSTAILLLLERLEPAERVALVLHDVFEISHQRVAAVLGRTPGATRQLAARARRKVARNDASTHDDPDLTEAPRRRVSHAERERVLAAFRAAHEQGDFRRLLALLDPEAVYVSDGGGVVSAARRPLFGSETVARLLWRLRQRHPEELLSPARINGETGFLVFRSGRLVAVDTIEVAAGAGTGPRITTYRRLRNPEKLGHLRNLTDEPEAVTVGSPR